MTLEPIWSWPVVVLTALALTAFVWATYRAQAAALTVGRRRTLLALKLIAVAVLVFAMFRPAVQFTETDENSAQLLIALDVSRSMNTPDGPASLTRFQAAQQDLQRQSNRWKSLSNRIAIRQFEFDQELRPAREGLTAGDGDATAIGATLESLLREVRQERTIGILLLSDGAQRALPPYDIDPLQAARKLAAEQAPVYPIGYGATSLSSAAADLALQDLLIDPVVFERKLVPIKVQLRALGANRQRARLRVLVEDRTGKTIGEAGELVPAAGSATAKVQTEVEIRGNQDTQTIDLSFIPQKPGELKVAVEVEPLEGEVVTRNNRVETIITVRQGGLRVAYLDSARPEQYFLRMVNGADKIQLDWIEIRRGRFRDKTRIDPALFDRGEYDVYILGDVPADVIGLPLLSKLADRVQEGAGLMMTGGLENFSAGGYGSSPIADFLPVVLAPGPGSGGPDLTRQHSGPQAMVPTETGLRRFVMQLASPEQNRATWTALAPLVGATRLQPKSDLVEVWAETRDGTPLLCAAEVGRARVVAFGGDTTYQWVMHERAREHQRFWRQMILWLARKEADSDQNIWVKVEPRNLFPGNVAPLEFGARTDTGDPIPDAEFQVEVRNPAGTVIAANVRRSQDQTFAEFAETQIPGDYWVRVSARKDGNQIGLDASTRFIVDATDLELDQPNADYETLQQIARLTGGQMLRSEDLDGFLDRLEQMKLDDLLRVRILPLWDNWLLLLLFVTILTAEWACRKAWGLA